MMNFETEIKWDANTPRAFLKMRRALVQTVQSISAPRQLHLRDVYLDHADARFEREKIALRLRCSDGVWEATFKTKTEVKNGRAVRREETLPLPCANSFAEALRALSAPKKWKNLDVSNLKPLFEIRNKRTSYDVVYDGIQAELSLDDCCLFVAGRRVYMKEIELELKQGAAQKLDDLAALLTAKSGLAWARVSKVKTASSLRALWGEK